VKISGILRPYTVAIEICQNQLTGAGSIAHPLDWIPAFFFNELMSAFNSFVYSKLNDEEY
jgi:hypothetical protein